MKKDKGFIAGVVCFAALLAAVSFFVIQLGRLDMLPQKIFIPVVLLAVLVTALISLYLLEKPRNYRKKSISRYVAIGAAVLCTIGSLLGGLVMKPIVVLENADEMSQDERLREVFRQIKVSISPITPPNYEIEKASQEILRSMGYRIRDRKKQQAQQLKRKKPGQALGRRQSANEDLAGKKKGQGRRPQKIKPEKKPETLAESHDE